MEGCALCENDIVSHKSTSMKFGTFMLSNVNSGESIMLARGTSVQPEELFQRAFFSYILAFLRSCILAFRRFGRRSGVSAFLRSGAPSFPSISWRFPSFPAVFFFWRFPAFLGLSLAFLAFLALPRSGARPFGRSRVRALPRSGALAFGRSGAPAFGRSGVSAASRALRTKAQTRLDVIPFGRSNAWPAWPLLKVLSGCDLRCATLMAPPFIWPVFPWYAILSPVLKTRMVPVLISNAAYTSKAAAQQRKLPKSSKANASAEQQKTGAKAADKQSLAYIVPQHQQRCGTLLLCRFPWIE